MGGEGGMMQIGMFALLIVVFYFFLIRPQQQKMKEARKFREALAKGDKVVTTGGIHGKVVEVKNDGTVLIDAGKTQLTVEKEALTAAFNPTDKK